MAERSGDPEDGRLCGYDADGWEDRVWILHTMYEKPGQALGRTHGDDERPGVDGSGVAVIGEATGVPLGRSSHPGPGWRRLSWAELGERLGVDPLARLEPSATSWPYRSWPAAVRPPAEGGLDRESFDALLRVLSRTSSHDGPARCHVFWAALLSPDMATPVHEAMSLASLGERYDHPARPFPPSNIWPEDRSWLVLTHWDLWATRVSGPASLIEAITADPELETAPCH